MAVEEVSNSPLTSQTSSLPGVMAEIRMKGSEVMLVATAADFRATHTRVLGKAKEFAATQVILANFQQGTLLKSYFAAQCRRDLPSSQRQSLPSALLASWSEAAAGRTVQNRNLAVGRGCPGRLHTLKVPSGPGDRHAVNRLIPSLLPVTT